MKKIPLYEYLGTNGTILSEVHLEDIYYVKKWRLYAGDGKSLTKDGEYFYKTKIVPDDELAEWREI